MASTPIPAPFPTSDDDSLAALQSAVAVLAAKWSVVVLARLASGTHRFNELFRQIDGVSRRMLSATLRQLERDGLVERHVYARVPARVEYELSSAGEHLLVALVPLAGWGLEHQHEVHDAREKFDRLQQWRSEGEEIKARSSASPRIV
ncbi:MAG TPA: helix-turn-helix domain-containing protein [Solirubrobacteraceae bacterium]|jgi:DNA-binding HxlR family transcriptional regulator|nr:helix-turn-helix domain-containing protein [Solirubrobacteraceae bacterium]